MPATSDGKEPDGLAHAVGIGSRSMRRVKHPKSDNMPWLTWAENVERLKAILLQEASERTAALEETVPARWRPNSASGLG